MGASLLLDRARRADPRVVDVLLVVAVAVIEVGGVFIAAQERGVPPVTGRAVAILLVTIVPLAWRRQAPVATWAVIGLATAVYGAAAFPDPPLPLGALVALYTVAARCPKRTAVTMAGVTAVIMAVSLLASGDSDALDAYLGYLLFGLAWILGDRQQMRRAHVAEAASRAVAEERARIARELHDVVAHHVSMMVVQAEAGASVAGAGPERTVPAFDAIATTGRDAMAELRRLLGVLRSDQAAAPTAPQPGLDRVDELVAQLGTAGLPVDVRVEGTPRPVAAGVGLSAYRIIQEALTNTLRHAGPARARVVVRYRAEAVEVEVTDDGRGRAGDPGLRRAGDPGLRRDGDPGLRRDGDPGLRRDGDGAGPSSGQGLLGIRERVALAGGSLEAGPLPGGGFGVVARLPTPGG